MLTHKASTVRALHTVCVSQPQSQSLAEAASKREASARFSAALVLTCARALPPARAQLLRTSAGSRLPEHALSCEPRRHRRVIAQGGSLGSRCARPVAAMARSGSAIEGQRR